MELQRTIVFDQTLKIIFSFHFFFRNFQNLASEKRTTKKRYQNGVKGKDRLVQGRYESDIGAPEEIWHDRFVFSGAFFFWFLCFRCAVCSFVLSWLCWRIINEFESDAGGRYARTVYMYHAQLYGIKRLVPSTGALGETSKNDIISHASWLNADSNEQWINLTGQAQSALPPPGCGYLSKKKQKSKKNNKNYRHFLMLWAVSAGRAARGARSEGGDTRVLADFRNR